MKLLEQFGIILTLVVSLTTVIVMVISGHITQFIIVSNKKKKELAN